MHGGGRRVGGRGASTHPRGEKEKEEEEEEEEGEDWDPSEEAEHEEAEAQLLSTRQHIHCCSSFSIPPIFLFRQNNPNVAL